MHFVRHLPGGYSRVGALHDDEYPMSTDLYTAQVRIRLTSDVTESLGTISIEQRFKVND